MKHVTLSLISIYLAIDGLQLTDRPTVAELVEMLDSLVEWKKFGVFLPGITDPDLKKIEKDRSSVDDQKMVLFSKWLRVDPDATWYKVIEALKKAKENFLVDKIERKFLKSLFLIMFLKHLINVQH